MTPSRKHVTSDSGERGTSLVELLVATSIGLGLAALLGHTMTAYQIHYHHAVTRIDGDQQAHGALALMADELDTLLAMPASTTCPPGGVRVTEGGVEFAANLYDRSAILRNNVAAGLSELVVVADGSFEAGDLVMIVEVNDPTDPGDDVADCLRIAAVNADQWALEHALARSLPAGTRVVLVNRVTYALDRLGRLMRTQDGGTQRIAQGVEAFDPRLDGNVLVVRLGMRRAADWTRRIALGDAP